MLVVIADDLSGAAELAGAALRHGLRAEVQTAFEPASQADVICVDTDSRSLPPDEAARVVGTVARRVAAARPDWIFKKCDSALRGSVLAEARAIATATGLARITLLAANPSRGRVVRAGLSLFDGRPLHETAFAHDPEHPRLTSRVADLLGGDLQGVETPDAETFADVVHEASRVAVTALPVGAADFFTALLQVRVSPRAIPSSVITAAEPLGPTLAVCGSAASWARRRAEAVAHCIPVFALPHDLAAIIQALGSTGRGLIGIGDGPSTLGRSPGDLVRELAATVGQVLRYQPVVRLLTEGGATTAAILGGQGWTRLAAATLAAPGVGALRPVGLAGAPLLFIKPGSYPWPAELWPVAAISMPASRPPP